MKIEDEFKEFIKRSRAAEAKKTREEKDALIAKRLKESVGSDD